MPDAKAGYEPVTWPEKEFDAGLDLLAGFDTRRESAPHVARALAHCRSNGISF